MGKVKNKNKNKVTITVKDQKNALNWYGRLLKKLNRQLIIAWILFFIAVVVSALFLMGIGKGIKNYQQLNGQIQELSNARSNQRAAIQQSVTPTQRQKFQRSQTELAENWTSHSENYKVTIKGQEVVMDRNNIFVSDNAQVLKDATKQRIYLMNQEFAEFNEGQQLMVVTVQRLPLGMTVESFANAVFNQLGIGQAEQDNGLLYVMAIDNQKTRIEVGYGLEDTVTDAQAGAILDDEDTVADFKEEDYDQGVNRILDQLYTAVGSLTPEYDSQIRLAQEQERTNKIFSLVCFVLFIFCFGSASLFLSQTRKVRKHAQQLTEKDIYFLSLAAPGVIWSVRHLKRLMATGKVMAKHPGAKRKGTNVLVGNRLYDASGSIITHDYASYQSSNSSGGSSSGGSFGGGSSGGGGASGGW